ncbi:MAG: DinB family protein [Chitinophagales bacterium]|nr:DinB family protein [Chitinophagales bacterium]
MTKNIFDPEVTNEVLERINNLTPETQPQWGKMNVAQMLAHCNVTYEMAYEDKHKKPGKLMRIMLKMFVKNAVVNAKPYPKNSRTAPQFLVSDKQEFEREKERLINYIKKTIELGREHFEGRKSHSFDELTAEEWNNMFYKHLDHHLRQFGV